MYLYMNNVIGTKTIHLPLPIDNRDGKLEIAIVNFFQDNVTWDIESDLAITLKSENGKAIGLKIIPKKLYTERELKAFLAGNIDLSPLDNDNPKIEKINRLANITEMNFYLDKLDNTEILVDDQLSNLFLKYFVDNYKGFTNYLPKQPHYKKLKNGIIDSLTLQILDQNNNMISDSLGVNVLLHIR